MNPISIETAEQYAWDENCTGWHLVKSAGMSVIQERVPPGKTEVRHAHRYARQFFFILEGEATIALDERHIRLTKHEGMKIMHQLRTESPDDIVFLVISVPPSHGDRIRCEENLQP